MSSIIALPGTISVDLTSAVSTSPLFNTKASPALAAGALVDGFRETYPAARAYTFIQPQNLGGSQSRIDRLYVKRDLYEEMFEWDIQAVGINTDHRMVTMKISTADTPTISHGRWVWPAHIIRDKVLAEFIDSEGLKLMAAAAEVAKLEEIGQWNTNNNVQTLWMKYKLTIGNKARERAKIVVPTIVEEIVELKNKIDAIEMDEELTEEEIKLSCTVLQEKLSKLAQQKHNDTRLGSQIRNRLEGEVITKYWTGINKPYAPREIIHRLVKDTRAEIPQYETNSKRMANMARDYHNKIQKERAEVLPEIREEKIKTVLERTTRKVTEERGELMKARLTLEEVRYALRRSANYKAPGLDGIPYEVWKVLDQRYESRKK
ncbi:hypothetical protein DFH08DRAFT_792658 [Mycena albidolilacea]|uniref:Uncharacterized protein n=1 Tax=Mycena albidolilacea TaxID=1033008 RepID=A0AAD7EAU5_9AGAR|nr:hypothetical protein DFH08DRAFT_792658 [Mycena albidolilacea]